ncbi:MAG: DUF2207 domain-containing protein [Clostridiales bacterium]|jgi:hypothetical protein|nr:DUF2207 domain-containing protein [Clostridiales bacterium]
MKMFFAAFSLFILSLSFGTPVYADDIVISSLDVDIAVGDDNTLQITESYALTFSGEERVIESAIPLTSSGKPVLATDISVIGAPFSYSVDSDNMYARVVIGDPLEDVSGEKLWALTYAHSFGKDDLADMDFFLHSVSATCEVKVEAASFSVHMPHPFKEDTLKFYYGDMQDLPADVKYEIEGNTLKGKVNGSIAAGDSITMSLQLPEGYFASAKTLEDTSMPMSLYFLFIIPVEALSFWLFHIFKGRKLFPALEYYPPKGLTPADMGYMIDGSADQLDMVSLILYWADKGYLDIIELPKQKDARKKKAYVFRKLCSLEPDAKAYERYMFDMMFAYGHNDMVSTAELRNSFYFAMQSAAEKLEKSYEEAYDKIFTKSFFKTMLVRLPALLCISIALAPVMADFKGYSFAASFFISIGWSALVLFISNIPLMIANAMASTFERKSQSPATVIALGSMAGIFILYGLLMGYFLNFLFAFAATLASLVLAYRSRTRTELGSEYQELLLGFKNYLLSAQKSRVEFLIYENPNYFYNILPFAMALGISDKWAGNFDHLVASPPSWYFTSSGQPFIASEFAESIHTGMHSMARDYDKAPSAPAKRGVGHTKMPVGVEATLQAAAAALGELLNAKKR